MFHVVFFEIQNSGLMTFPFACSKLPPHGIIDMLGNLRAVAVRLPQAPPLNLKVVLALGVSTLYDGLFWHGPA